MREMEGSPIYDTVTRNEQVLDVAKDVTKKTQNLLASTYVHSALPVQNPWNSPFSYRTRQHEKDMRSKRRQTSATVVDTPRERQRKAYTKNQHATLMCHKHTDTQISTIVIELVQEVHVNLIIEEVTEIKNTQSAVSF